MRMWRPSIWIRPVACSDSWLATQLHGPSLRGLQRVWVKASEKLTPEAVRCPEWPPLQQELRNPPVHVSQREALDQRSAFPHTAGEQPQRCQTDLRPFETEPHNLLAWQEQYERILLRRGGGRIGSTVKNGDFRERCAGPLDVYDLLSSVRADAISPHGSMHNNVEPGSGLAARNSVSPRLSRRSVARLASAQWSSSESSQNSAVRCSASVISSRVSMLLQSIRSA